MKKIEIYRCLPLKEWHQPFESTGEKWAIGGYRWNCGCPYGSHRDPRFLDYKDPLNLMEILSIKKGTKLLTLYSWKGKEHVAFHTFKEIEFLSDFIRLRYEEKVSVYESYEEQFTPLRFIASIDDVNEIAAFGKRGGINIFIKELARLSGFSVKEIKEQVEKILRIPIPPELKISVSEITEEAKKSGKLAPIFF